jgi:hypothetical protein
MKAKTLNQIINDKCFSEPRKEIKTRKKPMLLTTEQKEEVISLFLNNRDNTTASISKKLGFNESSVNSAIDHYLKQLKVQ